MFCHSRQHSIVLVNTQETVFRLDITEQLFNGALDINTKTTKKKKKHLFEKLMFRILLSEIHLCTCICRISSI